MRRDLSVQPSSMRQARRKDTRDTDERLGLLGTGIIDEIRGIMELHSEGGLVKVSSALEKVTVTKVGLRTVIWSHRTTVMELSFTIVIREEYSV